MRTLALWRDATSCAILRRVRVTVPVVLLALASGCGAGGDDERPAPQRVTGSVDLDKPRAGAPDAGTAAGHGNDGAVGATGGATFAFTGRVRPAGSRVAVRAAAGVRTAVAGEPSGRFSVALDGLRPGPNAITVTATRPRARSWSLDVRVNRGSEATVTVPERDTTAPIATLRLEPPGGEPVLSVSPSSRDDRSRVVRLTQPRFRATAIARDDRGGTGRIRLSTSYETRCPNGTRRTTRYLPPAQIANVALPPGAEAPAERRRTATITLRRPAGCRVDGEVWAEATDGHGLQAVTRHVRFVG